MSFPDFAFALGEESSDPISIRGGEVVRVDELAASGHLACQDVDLSDVASLGVRVFRYGMPWRNAEPSPGVYDWAEWDAALDACQRHGVEPIVDLCHFGLPDHLNGFCDPAWVDAFIAYFESFCDRYPMMRWFTPVNEPTMASMMSGYLGLWNDRLSSDESFAQAISLCVLANLEAHARLVADRDGWTIGAEALALPALGRVKATDERRIALHRVAWDLSFGHDLDPTLVPIFAELPTDRMRRIADLAIASNHIAGHDFYPVSVIGMPDDVEEILDAYEAWATDWHERYTTPFWVAETSNLGLDVSRQTEWLDALVKRLVRMRTDGLPVRGLCWYSRGDQFDWQTALIEPTGALTEVGLFTHDRTARPAAARFGELAAADLSS